MIEGKGSRWKLIKFFDQANGQRYFMKIRMSATPVECTSRHANVVKYLYSTIRAADWIGNKFPDVFEQWNRLGSNFKKIRLSKLFLLISFLLIVGLFKWFYRQDINSLLASSSNGVFSIEMSFKINKEFIQLRNLLPEIHKWHFFADPAKMNQIRR